MAPVLDIGAIVCCFVFSLQRTIRTIAIQITIKESTIIRTVKLDEVVGETELLSGC